MANIKFKGDPVSVPIGKRSIVELPPRAFRARLTGFLFETDKCFILPQAMHGIRRVKHFYDEHPGLSVLVTGHTDTVGRDGYNVSLSVDRARSVSAFLRDVVEEWLIFYAGTGHSHPWGTREDQHMLATLPENQPVYHAGPVTGISDPATREAIRRFQYDEGLVVDGIAGPQTRRALITRYMALEHTSLPPGTPVASHGCGPFHQAVPTGPDVENAKNRRAEVFLFEGPVTPPPRTPCQSPGCPEYPAWVGQVVESFDIDLTIDDNDPLGFSVVAPATSDVVLQVLDSAETVIRTLTSAEGERTGEQVRFSFLPAALPNPTLLRVMRDSLAERLGGSFDPAALRDAHERGDLDAVARIFDGEPSGGGSDGAGGAALVKQQITSAAPASVTDLKLRVHYNNRLHEHRFVKTRTIALTDQSGASILGQTSVVDIDKALHHAVTFAVPPTATSLDLTVRIDDPTPSSTPILLIREHIAISRQPGAPPVAQFTSAMNRRWQFAATSSTKTANTFIDLHLDLTFLDVTRYASALPNNNTMRSFLATTLRCQYVLLEFTLTRKIKETGAFFNMVLAVVIPPSYDVNARSDTNLLLFFRNEVQQRIQNNSKIGGFYSNTDDCDFGSVEAYFRAPAAVGTYLPRGTTFEEYPIFGWDRQLTDSQKEVIALFPIPLNAGFLDLDDPASAPRLFRHILVALVAEGRICRATGVTPTVNRLAIGGWSSGTNHLYDTWTALTPSAGIVDELYFFDGVKPLPNLIPWFKAKPGRCMRLLGTAYTEDSSVQWIKAMKPPSPDATAIPGDLSYWYTNADFQRAFTPRANPALPIEKFKPQGATPSSPRVDVSDDLGIFRVTGGPAPSSATYQNAFITVSWTDASGKVSTQKFDHLSETELASLMRYFSVQGQQKQLITTKAEFDQVISNILNTGNQFEKERTHKLRHPWSTAGGSWDATGTVFTGHLQTCLQLSKF